MTIREEIEEFAAVAQRVSPQGAKCFIDVNETILSASGSSAAATGLVPAGSILLGVVARNLSSITGCTGYNLGDGTNATRFAMSFSNLINQSTSAANFTTLSVFANASALNPTITAIGSNFTGGNVRLSAFFLRLFGPSA